MKERERRQKWAFPLLLLLPSPIMLFPTVLKCMGFPEFQMGKCEKTPKIFAPFSKVRRKTTFFKKKKVIAQITRLLLKRRDKRERECSLFSLKKKYCPFSYFESSMHFLLQLNTFFFSLSLTSLSPSSSALPPSSQLICYPVFFPPPSLPSFNSTTARQGYQLTHSITNK